MAKKAGAGDKKAINTETDDQDQDDDLLSPINELSPSNETTPPAKQQPSSTDSPETSPEPSLSPQPAHDATAPSTPPTVVTDTVGSPKRDAGPSPSGLGVSRMSWQGPTTDSAKRAPTLEVPSVDEENIVNLRRPSLPTHLGHTVGLGLGGPPNSFRMRPAGFDPSQRRMSLDRLASHPYAHVAVAANGAYFSSLRPTSHPHRRLPIGSMGQPPSHAPQPHRTDMPQSIGGVGHSVVDGAERPRPELMHRASMPAQAMHIPRSFDYSGPQMNSELLVPPSYRMNLPREGHLYALSSRHYQPPVAGPLPAPGYSFGTSTSTPPSAENENDNQSVNALQAYPFQPDQDADGEEEAAGQYDAYSRFGSIASIAGSESSIASGYYSEVGSFDIRPSTSQSLQGHGLFDQDGRRQSW